MENNRFEDSFKNAFSEAEAPPSETVWTNIELDLEKASSVKIKRNLLMFQLLAAASVTFALGMGALYYLDPLNHRKNNNQVVAKQDETSSAELNKEAAAVTGQNNNGNDQDNTQESLTHNVKNPSILKSAKKDIEILPITGEQKELLWITYSVAKTDLLSIVKTKVPVLNLSKPEEHVEPDAGMLLLARLKDEEKKYQEEDKTAKSKENIWASVGFGTGSYRPNVQSSTANLNGLKSSAASSESESGASYSVGLNVAGKISERFVVQGGISYLTQNADFTTSTITNHGSAALDEFVKTTNFESFAFESPYTVSSSMQFVSIPVQAGFILVNRNFGVQLNGGVATDLFIQNTLTPDNENYDKVTQSSGKESPYRTVNFSGLFGTEFSYRVANHYRISVNPGLRYSLNSVYKEEVAAEITPVAFDVSLRFRYIFK